MGSLPADVPAIETAGLTKRFDGVTAVDGIDLHIDAGTVYGFLGPNGSGKTTTMRMLTSLTRPTAGEARVAGIDCRDRRSLIEVIGYLPEDPPLFEELTAREQLRYMADLRGLDRADADERIDDALERFDLADDADRRIEGYSKGMRQKTGFIQATLHDPPVVLFDEPTSGLDPRAARAVKDRIAELASANRTVFLSTHILPVVEELADRIGVLHHGRVVAEDPPEVLRSRAEAGQSGSLEAAFLDITAEQPVSRE